MKLGGMFGKGGGKAIGVDIGSHSVKLAEITKRGGKHVLTNYGIAKLLPDAIVDGEVMDREVVIDTIRDLMESRSIQGADVATAVSGRAVIVKKILVDRLPPNEASEAIYLEAEHHIPFGIDDVYLDYQVLRDSDAKSPDKMEVLLVAAKREMVDAHVALLQDAGFMPRIVDVDAFAVQNAYEANTTPEEGETVLLMNVGASVTNLNIVRDGIPLFTRDIWIAGNTFVEQIQKRMSVNREQALATLTAEGAETSSELADVVSTICEDLAVGVERSVSFLKSSGEADKIDRIVVAGGSSRIPGLLPALAERHAVSVEVGNCLARVAYADGLFTGEDIEALAPQLTVAVGLALRTR